MIKVSEKQLNLAIEFEIASFLFYVIGYINTNFKSDRSNMKEYKNYK